MAHAEKPAVGSRLARVLRSQSFPLCVGSGLFLVVWLLCLHLVEEDAYIYFRLAENIAFGNGYRFNASGQTVEAGSSPLWLALLSLLVAVEIPALVAAKLMGLSLGFASLVLVDRIARSSQIDRLALLVSFAALPFSIPFVYWASAGLETPLYSCCLLFFARSLITPTARTLSFAIALLFFARPEGFVVVAFSLAVLAASKQLSLRLIARSVGSAGAAYLAYLVFRAFYFHDLQISPFYVKPPTGWSLGSLVTFVMDYRLWFLPAALLMLPFAGWRSSPRHRALLVLLVVAVPVAGFAMSNHDFKLFARFYAPLIPLAFLIGALSLTLVAERWPGVAGRAVTGLYALLVLSSLFVIDVSPLFANERIPNPIVEAISGYTRPEADFAGVLVAIARGDVDEPLPLPRFSKHMQNVTIYRSQQAQAGSLIRDIAPRGSTIVYDQMGQTAYFSGKDKVYIDLLGLVTKEVAYQTFGESVGSSFLYRAYYSVLRLLPGVPPLADASQRKSRVYDHVFQQTPELIVLNKFVLRAFPTGIAAGLRADPRLRERYFACLNFGKLVELYARKDVRLRPPKQQYAAHRLAIVDQRCFAGP